MISLSFILRTGILLISLGSILNAQESRTWIRQADGRKIEAALVGYEVTSGKATLQLSNGTSSVIDSAILSEADRDYLKEYSEKMAAAVAAAKVARSESFVPEGGGGHQIHLYKPVGYVDGDPANSRRPVAFLYSAGGDSKSIMERLKPAAEELGWVLVGIDAYKNTSSLEEKYEERLANTKTAFADASARVVFDPSKIVFGGMSGGGWWSYQSAAELTQNAAGILAFGGWMGKMYDQKYSKKMAVAMINGDQDTNAIAYEQPDGDFLDKRASAKVKVFHFSGGHILAPVDIAKEAARWIHETKKF